MHQGVARILGSLDSAARAFIAPRIDSISFLDTVGVKFRENTRLGLHLLIIEFVITTTLVSYEKVLPKTISDQALAQAKPTVIPVRQYKVALPYVDRTLEKHVGAERMRETLFYFLTMVESTSRGEAVLKAKEIALSNERGVSKRSTTPGRCGSPKRTSTA